jgi:hypothetical protein
MPLKNKREKAEDSPVEGYPRQEGSEYERGRKEAVEESEEHRILEEKEAAEEHERDHEVRGGHFHTPYFEYDNPSHEDKNTFKSGSPDDEKKPKRRKWL